MIDYKFEVCIWFVIFVLNNYKFIQNEKNLTINRFIVFDIGKCPI